MREQGIRAGDDRVLYEHLRGEIVAGMYPLIDGDRCHFVAVDFDGAGWQEDVRAYASTARDVGVPVAVERSRSGNGAHAWFFFETAVPASAARHMASYVLTEAMSRRPEIGMMSYDRLFPNQNTLPRSGFGNLIALPLQREARQHGNSVVVNDAFQPFTNQWEFLAGATLAADEARNTLILDDVIAALEAGRSPLLLTERRDHLDLLAARLGRAGA